MLAVAIIATTNIACNFVTPDFEIRKCIIEQTPSTILVIFLIIYSLVLVQSSIENIVLIGFVYWKKTKCMPDMKNIKAIKMTIRSGSCYVTPHLQAGLARDLKSYVSTDFSSL